MARKAMEAHMFRRSVCRIAISLGLLITMGVCGLARADSQWQSWNPDVVPGSSVGQSGQTAKQPVAIYDIAPAMARSAVAAVSYDQAYANLRGALANAGREFENAPDMVAAERELNDAMIAYEAACEPVRGELLDRPEYHSLIEKRTEMEIVISSPEVSAGEKLAAATRKMEYASVAARMEANALMNDPAVVDAKLRLDAARQVVSEKNLRFEMTLYQQPAVAAAQREFDLAKLNRAGADAYLQGAWITRADSLDADQRRYPGTETVQYASPATVYWGNPYWWGYYGIPWHRF